MYRVYKQNKIINTIKYVFFTLPMRIINKCINSTLFYNLIIILIFILIFYINIPTAGEDDLIYCLNEIESRYESWNISYTHSTLEYRSCTDNTLKYIEYVDNTLPFIPIDNIPHIDNILELHTNNTPEYSHNTTYMVGPQDGENRINKNYYIDRINANKIYIRDMYGNYVSSGNIIKRELNISFEASVEKYMHWHALDKDIYTKKDIKGLPKFEALYKSLTVTKACNIYLNLNWEDACRVYAVSHHRDLPFVLSELKYYSPETFFTHMENKYHGDMCLVWRRTFIEYLNNPDKKNELYTYVRIAEYTINKNE